MSVETIVVILALLAAVWVMSHNLPLPKHFRSRPCQGATWRRSFPCASKEQIRSFLRVFIDALAFPDRRALKFSPEDRISVIYRAMYPFRWQPDSLELETLAVLIAEKYDVRLAEIWNESLTLGELFAVAHETTRELA
jgi:hypothetical protein